MPCPGCGRARLFRAEEVFVDDRLTVALNKPCPHCGDTETLRLQRFAEAEFFPLRSPAVNVPWILLHLRDPQEGDSDDALAAMFEADQSSRRDGTMSRRDDDARLQHVLTLLDRQALRTPADYHHAAAILHHSAVREHYHLAFELARRAADAGYSPARWWAAAALDRWLMSAGLPQKFGTQHRFIGSAGDLWMVDPTTTDEERAAWDVAPLAELHERARRLSADRAGASPPRHDRGE